jgi:hypothetical protein
MDRQPVRQPLRDVAHRLVLTLDEADTDWSCLAYRALRIMLDANGPVTLSCRPKCSFA